MSNNQSLQDAMKAKDEAYWERNRLVAILARIWPSGRAITDIPGWDQKWHNCVYIDSPRGQLSWHIHDDEMVQFASLPEYTKPWDGHTTEEKYRRLLLNLLDLESKQAPTQPALSEAEAIQRLQKEIRAALLAMNLGEPGKQTSHYMMVDGIIDLSVLATAAYRALAQGRK